MNAFTTIMTAPNNFCKVSLHTTIEGAERAACQEIAAYAEDRGMDAEIVKAARAGDYQDARRRLYGAVAGSIEIVSLPVHASTPLMGSRLIESEERTAADTTANASYRSSCIARVCTRALGVGGIGLDGDLLHVVDVAVRSAVTSHLSR